MKRRTFVWAMLSPAAAAALGSIGMGCGGSGSSNGRSGNSTSGSGRGQFLLTFRWPERNSRLIPALSQSIRVTLTGSDGTVLGTRLIVGNDGAPQISTETFTNLAPGTVTLTATAFPNSDATGVAQATGVVQATIQTGQTTRVTLTMGSTIASIEVTPANPSITVGQRLRLTATPRDRDGNVVLVTGGNVTWTSGNTAVAVPAPENGQGIEAVGASAGAALFTVTERDSGKSGSTNVTVGTVVANGCVPGPVTGPGGLANTPWPKPGHDLANTYRGGAGGATGVLKWTVPNSTSVGSPGFGNLLIGADGTLYTGNDNSTVILALNPADGTTLRQIAGLSAFPTLGSNGLIYAGYTNGFFARDLQTGDLHWSRSEQSGNSAIGADGTVYLGAYVRNAAGQIEATILALDGNTGAQKWSVPSANGSLNVAVGSDGTVYAVSSVGGLNAIDGRCGTIKWTYRPDNGTGFIGTIPSIGADGTVYVIGTGAGGIRLIAVDPAAGAQKWQTVVPSGFFSPSIAADGTLYLVSGTGQLTAYDPVTGGQKWAFNGPGVQPGVQPTGFGAASIASDGTVYFTASFLDRIAETKTSRLFALEGATGSLKWTYQVPGNSETSGMSPVIGPDGTVYIVDSDNGKLIAVK